MSSRDRSTVAAAQPVHVFVVQDKSPAELAALAALQSERLRLIDKLTELEQEANGEGASGDPGDRGTQAAAMSKRSAMRGLWARMLGEVERALARVESGAYGRCEACSATIPAERLQALPSATLCVACARRQIQKGGLR